MKNVYVVYRISEDWCHTVGIYTTFEKAEAGLNRYLTDIGLNAEIPNNPLMSTSSKDAWHKHTNTMDNFWIYKKELDQDL